MEAPARRDVPPAHAPGKGILAIEQRTRGAIIRAAGQQPPQAPAATQPRPRRVGIPGQLWRGLVDGDSVHIEVDVDARAAGLLSTQSATKVYRSPRGCRQALQARVGEDALLVLLPDPVACFAGARYEQEPTVTLAPRASLVLVDAFTCALPPRLGRFEALAMLAVFGTEVAPLREVRRAQRHPQLDEPHAPVHSEHAG